MEFASFRNVLGQPAYEDDDVLLYHGDSLQLMEQLPPDSIPLTITSPPYNIGKEYEQIRKIDDYVEWTARWTKLVHDKTTRSGAMWLNLGYISLNQRAKAIPIPYLIWDRVPFFLIQEIVWNYGAGVAGRLFFSPRNEKFLWYVKDPDTYVFNLDDIRDPNVKYPNQKKNGKLKCNPNGKNPTDVWQIAKVTSGKDRSSHERTPHPAQFPLELITRIILASSVPSDVTFDPFAGSGSLLEAAIRTGRKAIGIEIDRGYVSIAIDRIRNAQKDVEARKKQSSLFELKLPL
jgi:adenine-specific DNA-methyltransferase